MKTQIGTTESNRQAVANTLIKVLADENVLYVKTKNANWNVEGADFYDKHLFFETHFEQLDDMIDSVAERIRSIGHYAPATLNPYLGLTQLTEKNKYQNDSQGFIKELLGDYESIINMLCKHIKPFADDFHDLVQVILLQGLWKPTKKWLGFYDQT
jgi:starvation-inducible DNA-binding protein